jgi:hypothetical protein
MQGGAVESSRSRGGETLRASSFCGEGKKHTKCFRKIRIRARLIFIIDRAGDRSSGRRCVRFRGKAFSLIMHQWTAKHWIVSAIIVVVAVGAFAYSWS